MMCAKAGEKDPIQPRSGPDRRGLDRSRPRRPGSLPERHERSNSALRPPAGGQCLEHTQPTKNAPGETGASTTGLRTLGREPSFRPPPPRPHPREPAIGLLKTPTVLRLKDVSDSEHQIKGATGITAVTDGGVLDPSRSSKVCMTCHWFRHHAGAECSPGRAADSALPDWADDRCAKEAGRLKRTEGCSTNRRASGFHRLQLRTGSVMVGGCRTSSR